VKCFQIPYLKQWPWESLGCQQPQRYPGNIGKRQKWILSEPNNCEDLADKLSKLIMNESLRKEMGETALKPFTKSTP